MRFLICFAILGCCLYGLQTITKILAYSDSAEEHLLSEGHERAALHIFVSDYRQKVALDGTVLIFLTLQLQLICVAPLEETHPLRFWNVGCETWREWVER